MNLTKEQNDTISANLAEITKCLGEFESASLAMGDKLDDDVEKLFDLSQDYLDSIKSVQALVCPPPGMDFGKPAIGIANITGHTLVPNFKATNWIEGGVVTVQQLQLEWLNKGVNWTSCPLDRPFLIGGDPNCQACPA